MKLLSKHTLKEMRPVPWLSLPGEDIFSLPEKVLQFGSGALLRGLPDYFIDKANRQGIFNGRVVVVKSTSAGDSDTFSKQDGLYTHVIRGTEDGRQVDKMVVNSSVSRVLSASGQWKDILACAANPELKLIISNTTEVGITLIPGDSILAEPPVSFPGKLLAFLWERYRLLGGGLQTGFVIIPTELIPDNASQLRAIVLELARQNQCDASFIDWVMHANYFCNSLVDRIVPGKLVGQQMASAEQKLGYTDELLIMSEVFSLWAIECLHPSVRHILTFAQADEGVVLTDDLETYRELKLRLLNGTHTLSCAYAFLSGFQTVGDAMRDVEMGKFITRMAISEIAPATVSGKISYQQACAYAGSVFDRFRNPFLEHKWISISAQYTSKMKMRVIPILLKHYRNSVRPPNYMAVGIAAYLLMLRVQQLDDAKYAGNCNGKRYTIQDDDVELVASVWRNQTNPVKVFHAVFSQTEYWGADITALPGLEESVCNAMESMLGTQEQSAVKTREVISEHM